MARMSPPDRSFDGPTAAHEIGHTFGRDHAPCGDAPNQDERYPTFNAFPGGSIGEFGIDDTGAIFDPALTLDFMAQHQCQPAGRWVSPYTYEALRQHFRTVTQAITPLAPSATEHLFT
jgi:hypothetical protein